MQSLTVNDVRFGSYNLNTGATGLARQGATGATCERSVTKARPIDYLIEISCHASP